MSCCKDPPSPPPATTDNDHNSSSHMPRPALSHQQPLAPSPEHSCSTRRHSRPRPPCLTHSHPLFSSPCCLSAPAKGHSAKIKLKNLDREIQFSWLAAFRVRSLCRNRPRSRLTYLLLSLLWCLPPLLKVPLTPSRPAAPPARRLPATSIIAHLSPSTTTYRPPPPRASPTPTTTTYYDLPGPAARHDLLVLPPV